MLELRTTNGGADGGGRILWKKLQDEFVNAYISSSRVGAGVSSKIEFGTNSGIYTQDATTKVTITGAGNVGIGTTSPGNTIHRKVSHRQLRMGSRFEYIT
jgi:hypothetical protein